MARYKITKGPSKWALSVAFFDKFDSNKAGGRRPVTFVISPMVQVANTKIEVVINSLCWADGSGESWGFEGFVVEGMQNLLHTGCVKGYFRTYDREGWIELDTR